MLGTIFLEAKSFSYQSEHGRPENLEDLRNAIDGRLVKDVPKSNSSMPRLPRLGMDVGAGSVKTHAEKYRSLSVQGKLSHTNPLHDVSCHKNSKLFSVNVFISQLSSPW